MTRYEIILYWSADDDAFIAEVPELPGCAGDGPTRQEALANAETVIQEWVETAREFGRSIPEPKGRVFVYRAGAQPRHANKSSSSESALKDRLALKANVVPPQDCTRHCEC